jgi:hypothetical protein
VKQAPWYVTTLRWAQTNLTEIDPSRYDGEWWRAHWKKTRVQGAIINAGGIVAYYPSDIPFHHRAETLGARDLYGEIVTAAREDGIAVVARMDSNRVAQDLFDAHPDWICRGADGEPYTQADKYVTCITSDYYREFLPNVLREIIERSHPDGFADNSWAGLPRNRICHCESCQTQFRATSGHGIPLQADWDDAVYRDWVAWNYRLRTELWEFNNTVTMQSGGEHCRWMGMISGELLNNCRRFIDLGQILTRTPIVMLDHQRRSRLDGFDQNAECGKRLHELAGWNILIPESMPQYQLGAPSFRHASMPEAEVRLWSSAGFAGGIQPWWHHIGANHDDRRQYRSAEPIFQWHEANQDVLVNRLPQARIGVLWSQANHDLFGRDNGEELTQSPYRGATMAMDWAGLAWLPVEISALDGARERFDVLVLPNIGILSDSAVDALRTFAAGGGGLVATGETGTFDAVGARREIAALSDLFGVQSGSGPSHGGIGAPNLDIETHARHSYLRLSPENRSAVYGPFDPAAPTTTDTRHPILDGLQDTDSVPFGGYLTDWTVAGDATVLATLIPDFPIFPPETSWMRTPSTDIPAIVVRETSEGARMVRILADLDRCYAREGSVEHARIISNAVRWSANAAQVIVIEGGLGQIYVNHFHQDEPGGGRDIVHLNNRLISRMTPGRQEVLFPIGPVTLTLRLPQDKPRTVKARVSGEQLEVETLSDGAVRVTVPVILDHEVLVISRS